MFSFIYIPNTYNLFLPINSLLYMYCTTQLATDNKKSEASEMRSGKWATITTWSSCLYSQIPEELIEASLCGVIITQINDTLVPSYHICLPHDYTNQWHLGDYWYIKGEPSMNQNGYPLSSNTSNSTPLDPIPKFFIALRCEKNNNSS